MKIKFFPYNDSEDSAFASNCDADCIEIHLQNYIIGIFFWNLETWRLTQSFEKYPLDDNFNRVFEIEAPTLGIMVLRQ